MGIPLLADLVFPRLMVNEREAENVAVEFKTLQKVAPGDLWVFHPKVIGSKR